MAASVRIKQIRQAQADAKAKIADIIKASATEKRAMSDEEKAEIKAQESALDGLTEELTIVTRQAERERADASAAADAQASAASATIVGETAAATRVEVGADRTMDPKRPGLFGMQLHAVRNFALTGGRVTAEDAKLLAPMMAVATGANTDVPADGGFLVGQERSTTLLQRSYSQGEILKRVARLPIGAGSNGAKFPAIDETSRADNSRFGGIVSGWLGQGNTLPNAGKPKFREMDMKLRKVGAFVYATDEMLVDAVMFEGWVNRYLPLELTFRTEDSFLSGTGDSQPVGIHNSAATISVTRATAGHVVYADVKGMWHRMYAPCRKNAVWLIDQDVEDDLETLQVPIGTSGVLAPIYKPAGTMPGQETATLYGRPVLPVEYCAALGTTGDIGLYDFGEYTAIDKGGVEQAVSLHVAFLTDQACYRWMYRVDGQPTWNTTLTPKSGGNPRSPFIKLTT